MKIVNHSLPTEGVQIAGILFKPGEPKEVDEKLAVELIKRKGFVPAEETVKKPKGGNG